MSIPRVDCGRLDPGADGMIIRDVDVAGSPGWGLPVSIPGIERDARGWVLLLGTVLAVSRAGVGFALAVEALASGFLAGIGIPGMLCIDCASAEGEARAVTALAANAASRIMPTLPLVAR